MTSDPIELPDLVMALVLAWIIYRIFNGWKDPDDGDA